MKCIVAFANTGIQIPATCFAYFVIVTVAITDASTNIYVF